MGVIHQPRVAWDGACVFVAAATADAYWWLSDMIRQKLGATYQMDLVATRRRLQTEDARFAEIGAWRVRLEELLYSRPDLAPLLRQLVTEASARVAR